MNFAELTTLDYVVLSIIGLSTIIAFFRGFIASFLSLSGWILSIYLSYAFYPDIQPILEEKIKTPIIVLAAGHSALLIGFLIIFGIINLVSTHAMKGLTNNLFDRSLGLGFGFVRGAIIVSFIMIMATTSVNILNGSDGDAKETNDKEMPKWLTSSQTYPALKSGEQILADFIPDSMYERMKVAFDDISNKSMDERFYENMQGKLESNLTEEKKKALKSALQEQGMVKSQEQLDNEKVEYLIHEYKKNYAKKTDAPISKDDLKKFEKIYAKKSVKSTTEEALPKEAIEDRY